MREHEMNERQFGGRVRQVLNTGTRLDAGVAERLRASREQALLAKKPERRAALAWAGGPGDAWPGLGEWSVRLIAPMLVLVFGLLAIYGWQQDHQVAELVEIDARLLTDDLPIDAYLDKGFEAWLNEQGER